MVELYLGSPFNPEPDTLDRRVVYWVAAKSRNFVQVTILGNPCFFGISIYTYTYDGNLI